MANELLASPDIDLVVGHHVHVIQPIDRVGEKYVLFGVGNFLSNQSPQADPTLPAASQDGVIAARKREIDAILRRLSADHYAVDPEDVGWGHGGALGHQLLGQLQRQCLPGGWARP